MILAIPACGISGSKGEEPNFPVDPEKPSDALQKEELVHLEFFDQFDWYNQSVDNSGEFVLSETEQDGGLCYKFENTDLGVTILVPPADDSASPPVAAVSYQGKTLFFEMPAFVLGYGLASGSASLHLEDLTGDETPDLIYIYGGGGTGAWNDAARVFDLASMTECAVSWDNALLQEAISLRSVGVQDESAVFAITAPDGETVYGSTYYGEDSLPEAVSHSFGGYETLSLENGHLILSSSFTADIIPNRPDVFYLGSLTTPLVYNPKTGAFSLSGSFTLSVFEPAASDLVSDVETFSNPAEQAALLEKYQSLLKGNWYNGAMGCIYASPAEMDLGIVFHEWFKDLCGWEVVTAEEEAFLVGSGFGREINVQKRPASMMEELLQQYFGVSMADVELPSGWRYYPETDCYFSNTNDTFIVHSFNVTQVEQADDLIHIHYTVEPYGGALDPITGEPVTEAILTLRETEGGCFVVLSNTSIKDSNPQDDETQISPGSQPDDQEEDEGVGENLQEAKNPSISDLAFDELTGTEPAGVGFDIVFESEELLVFCNTFGVWGYDLSDRHIAFSVDLLKTFGEEVQIQGSYDPYAIWVQSSADGKTIVISQADRDTSIDPLTDRNAYYIDTETLTYEGGAYLPLESFYDRETTVGYIIPGGELVGSVYIRENESWDLFSEYRTS